MAIINRSSRLRKGVALLAAVSAAALPLAVTAVSDAAVSPDRAVTLDSPYVKANG
ncbi:MAG: hypothetical protein JWO11_3002, partial [Nocardioides sp.]|nr:hypothetical protein [Nocardioides sp.]